MAGEIKLAPMFSYSDLEKIKYKTMKFEGDWADTIGDEVELAGVWIIWGQSGNGKTKFALELAKYISRFEPVYYNSLEEKKKLSFRRALQVANIASVGNRIQFQSESFERMKQRLRKERSFKVVFVDSLQYLRITVDQYFELIAEFPDKLFVFTCHAQGLQPKGDLADEVRFDADVKLRVHQFVATPVEATRYGGNTPYVVWEEGMRKAQMKLT
jgi:hypothetical protein